MIQTDSNLGGREFEKSVISSLETPLYRLRPWILDLISALLIISGISLIGYTFISNPEPDVVPNNDSRIIAENNEKNKPDIGNGISTNIDTASTKTAKRKSRENVRTIALTGRWQATDYKAGDIMSGTYIVKQGDTLWEISEAVYGSGLDWYKIRDRNSKKIGYLEDGSQALIFPGQVFKLPA